MPLNRPDSPSKAPPSRQEPLNDHPNIPRIALTPDEAAAAIGCGRTLFREAVMPELRTIRLGRKRLIPVRELERWTAESAARILE